MANRSRARVNTVVRAPRASTNWARSVSEEWFLLAANSKVLALTTVLSNPGIGETVRRTRIVFGVNTDQGALFEDWNGALGGVVVNDLAVGVGVGSIPSPGAEASDDGWFVH